MINAQDLSALELSALLHFYADAGVDYLLEEEPVDRIAEFSAQREKQQAERKAALGAAREAARPQKQTTAPPIRPSNPLPVPDDEAIANARAAADGAADIAALRQAVATFEGCNMKNSARNIVFPGEFAQSDILVLGSMPSSDDDREGIAFSGRNGDLLERMLAAINVEKSNVTLAHCIPWRPPGDRPPTPAEIEICRPFAERLITLAQPRAIMLMGNIAVRFFIGNGSTIHNARGQWQELQIGEKTFRALPMFHPQDLILAPASKRLAWMDLLAFEVALKS